MLSSNSKPVATSSKLPRRVVDVDLVHLVARALLDLAELGLAGLGPELLLHDEGARRGRSTPFRYASIARAALCPSRDRVDDDRRPVVGRVAAGEDAPDVRRQRLRVDDEGVPLREADRAVRRLREPVESGRLPDRGHRHLAGEVELGALERDRAGAGPSCRARRASSGCSAAP